MIIDTIFHSSKYLKATLRSTDMFFFCFDREEGLKDSIHARIFFVGEQARYFLFQLCAARLFFLSSYLIEGRHSPIVLVNSYKVAI